MLTSACERLKVCDDTTDNCVLKESATVELISFRLSGVAKHCTRGNHMKGTDSICVLDIAMKQTCCCIVNYALMNEFLEDEVIRWNVMENQRTGPENYICNFNIFFLIYHAKKCIYTMQGIWLYSFI